MKYIFSLITILSFILAGCSNSNEPQLNQHTLIGYWALTKTKTINHIGNTHTTSEEEIPPHYFDKYASAFDVPYDIREDVLIFDETYVTLRGSCIPNIPRSSNYNMDTPEGQIQYYEELEKFLDKITLYTDQFEFPVNVYFLKDNEFYIGSMKIGELKFISDDSFCIDFTRQLQDKEDYVRYTYTYSRISSLIK